MMWIDLTAELSPVLIALNVALAVSAAALIGHVVGDALFRAARRLESRRMPPRRPVLVR